METILIVEDEQALLDSYGEILMGEGYGIEKASDGYKALNILEEKKGKIDLVLLDLMMPGIDGLEVLRTIVKNVDRYGNVPVVVLTAMVSDEVVKEAYKEGAKSYLIKSELEIADLTKEVERVLGKAKD